MKSTSKKRTPSIVNLTVKRRYLTQREIERRMDCARKHGRYGHRDATMILVAYGHGRRASEVCDLQWQHIELSEGRLHVHRAKNGVPSVHPIRGDEMRALRKLRRDYPRDAHVFVSERGGQSAPSASIASSSASVRPPRCHFRSTPTCCAMPAGSSSQMMATTRGPCSTTLGTRTFSTPSDTPKWRPTDSRIFGGTDDGGQDPSRRTEDPPVEEDDAPYRRGHSPAGARILRGMRSLGPTAVSASSITLFLGLGESSSGPRCTSTDIGSIVPSIIFAGAPACASSDVFRYSIMASSCSSVSSLSRLLCSTLCSRGTNSARILRYEAGCVRRTRSIAFGPPCRKSRSKAAINSPFNC